MLRYGSRLLTNNQVDFSKEGWAYEVGRADLRDVVESDAIFAIVNGTPPDEGVMVELGAAIALREENVPIPRRFSSLHELRGMPAKPHGVHRPAPSGMAGLLLLLCRRDQCARQGTGALAAGNLTSIPDRETS